METRNPTHAFNVGMPHPKQPFTHEGAQWKNVFNVQIVTFSFLRLTVGKNVPLQITSLTKCFVALTTFVQFLSGVSEEMPLHIGSQ